MASISNPKATPVRVTTNGQLGLVRLGSQLSQEKATLKKKQTDQKVVKDKKERTCLLIDLSIPTERNAFLKTLEKLSKYKDLEIEIKKMWE